MKRRFAKLVLFLFLGAIVNVAVAWGITARLSQFDVDVMLMGMVDLDDIRAFDWWAHHAPAGFDHEPTDGALASRLGASWAMASVWPGDHSSPPLQFLIRLRTGWPARSMEGACWSDAEHDCIYDGGMEFGDHMSANAGLLPLRPIWPGFAINMIFYATIVWLVTLGPFTVRRFIRRKRGRCIKCGYDLRGTSGGASGGGGGGVCPECGATTL